MKLCREGQALCLFSAILVVDILGCGGQTAGTSGHSASGASGASQGGAAGSGGHSGSAGSGGLAGNGGTNAGSGGSSEGGTGGLPQSEECNAWIPLPPDSPWKTSEIDILGTCGHAGNDCTGGFVCCVGICAMNNGKCFPKNNAHNHVDCYTPLCVSPESCYPGGIVTPQ